MIPCGGKMPGARISDFGFYFLIITGILAGCLIFWAMKVCCEEQEEWERRQAERSSNQPGIEQVDARTLQRGAA